MTMQMKKDKNNTGRIKSGIQYVYKDFVTKKKNYSESNPRIPTFDSKMHKEHQESTFGN